MAHDVPDEKLNTFIWRQGLSRRQKHDLEQKFRSLLGEATHFEFEVRDAHGQREWGHGTTIYNLEERINDTMLPRYVTTGGNNKIALCVSDSAETWEKYPEHTWVGEHQGGEYIARDFPVPLQLVAFFVGTPVDTIKIDNKEGNRQFGFRPHTFSCTKVRVIKRQHSYQAMPS